MRLRETRRPGKLGREPDWPKETEIWREQKSNGVALLSKAAGSWLGCRERTRGAGRQGARSELLGCGLGQNLEIAFQLLTHCLQSLFLPPSGVKPISHRVPRSYPLTVVR